MGAVAALLAGACRAGGDQVVLFSSDLYNTGTTSPSACRFCSASAWRFPGPSRARASPHYPSLGPGWSASNGCSGSDSGHRGLLRIRGVCHPLESLGGRVGGLTKRRCQTEAGWRIDAGGWPWPNASTSPCSSTCGRPGAELPRDGQDDAQDPAVTSALAGYIKVKFEADHRNPNVARV